MTQSRQENAAGLLFTLLRGRPEDVQKLTHNDLTTIEQAYRDLIPLPNLLQQMIPALPHNNYKFLEQIAAPLLQLTEDLQISEADSKQQIEQEQAAKDAQIRAELAAEEDLLGPVYEILGKNSISRPKPSVVKTSIDQQAPIHFNIHPDYLTKFTQNFMSSTTASLSKLHDVLRKNGDPKLQTLEFSSPSKKDKTYTLEGLMQATADLGELFHDATQELTSYVEEQTRSKQNPPEPETFVDSPFLDLVSKRNRQPDGQQRE